MRRQRKLTPAQRRVMRQIVADADAVMAGGESRSDYLFVADYDIEEKLLRRGYAVREWRGRAAGSAYITWPTPKGLAALT